MGQYDFRHKPFPGLGLCFVDTEMKQKAHVDFRALSGRFW